MTGAQSEGNGKILVVDDDPQWLQLMEMRLGRRFSLRATRSPLAAQEIMEREGPFAVLVSDLRMPEMDGIALLDWARRNHPDTVRMMISGYADLEAAIKAVNQGHIFRIMTKPSEGAILEQCMEDGLRQYQLVRMEREYHALKRMQEGEEGLVAALARMVEAVNPELAAHQTRVARLAEAMALAMELPEEEALEARLAANVHDIGLAYLSSRVISDPEGLKGMGQDLDKLHPRLGHDVLAPVKFSFPLAQVVRQHHERLDGSGFPDGLRNQQISLKARIIAVADVADRLWTEQGRGAATRELREGMGQRYDPLAVEAALTLIEKKGFTPED